ncbi:histone H4 transcription factor [Fopius arisanus]|uniref:Histone H4 transcription factor n=1 Tax=Fopius arisanus TaxID=64838 RepID=A0A9R1TDT4_9HYME|nr:PREDICTED: histone H4 transcription factor [Fopius arisanus]
MSDTMEGLMADQEGQEKCKIWVKSQTQLLEPSAPSLKREAACDLEEYFETDSEFDSVSECGAKKRRFGIQVKKEVLNLVCEWKNCSFKSCSIDRFLSHVATHVPDLEIKLNDSGDQVYACQWHDCGFENGISEEITRHVNFHAYHTKLKCIGSNIRERIKLPKCHRENLGLHVFNISSPQLCQWEECLKLFNNFQLFLYHIIQHLESNPRGNKVEGGVRCKWTGCTAKFPSVYKLKDHIKCHTKEKIVACPDCGNVFASNTKFHDHCRRQIPLEVQGFQCSYCTKFYPTEAILREHMRFHVFNHKCKICDMSCESPSSLVKHIRYRHVSARPFPCQLCSHSAKSQQDLDSHMTVHTSGPNFFCNYEGCTYTCKNAYVFDKHIERVHSSEVRWYCCHECPIKYRKSYTLTKHLVDVHNLQWPSGHKKFQYIREHDGCYRLQRFRYEGIDDDAAGSVSELEIDDPPKEYKIKVSRKNSKRGIPNFEIVEDTGEDDSNVALEVNTDAEDSAGKSMPVISNILISIDEMDAYGNIINSKIIKTQETTELPPSDEPPVILT